MIICEDIFAIFIYTDIAMMLKLQYSFNKWDSSKMADLQRKMASNQKMQENKPTLKFNFTIEKR